MKAKIILYTLIILVFSACKTDKPVEAFTGQLFSEISPLESGVFFVNGINESWQRNTMTYDYFYNGAGVALGDINNDGLTDIFFTGNDVTNKLYLNKGNMQFEDISQNALQSSVKWATGATMIDINNDGFLDIYVCNGGPNAESGLRTNDLYINNGDMTFTNKAEQMGVNDAGRSVQSSFFDYDQDGDLDLWVNNHSQYDGNLNPWLSLQNSKEGLADPTGKPRLYRNDGQKFTDVSKEAGIFREAFGLGLATSDFDDDGDIDVYVANDYFLPDYYYINNGDGTFTDKSKLLLAHTSFYSMGCDAADINNDGVLDLAVVDMTPEDHYRNKVLMESMDTERFRYLHDRLKFTRQYMYNSLQVGGGFGSFQEVGKAYGVSQSEWSWAALLADFDNDGYKDYYVTNGFYRDTKDNDFKKIQNEFEETPGAQYNENVFNEFLKILKSTPTQNQFYKNENGEKFSNQSTNWTNMGPSFSNGAAYGDLDNDGDLDLVLNNLQDTASILENKITGSNYLQVHLTNPNRTAASDHAVIKLYQGDKIQRADYNFTRGYQSSVQHRVHFGLGTEVIDSINVHWTDGTQYTAKDVKPNELITINKRSGTQVFTDTKAKPTRFMDITKSAGIDIFSDEKDFDDFATEILLPHKYSTMGPALAVGDVDGDGLDDFYIGGSQGKSGTIYTASGSSFSPIDNRTFMLDSKHEDLGATFLDVDNDGDLDLYVASGGGGEVAVSPILSDDRLYINSGNGFFINSQISLPNIESSTKSITKLDYNGDGKIDLFIGGRNTPGKYPLAAESYLLINTGGKFRIEDISSLQENMCGMITGATVVDLDGDGKDELIVVGEWCVPQIYSQTETGFTLLENTTLNGLTGWWQSIQTADIDKDGDQDIILGNMGENNKFNPSTEKPLGILASDFDDSGSIDIVLTKEYKGKTVPVRGKECSTEQMPFLEEKFPTYDGFASSGIEDILGADKISAANQKAVTTFSSIVLINKGNMNFEVQRLPTPAQWSPIMDMIIDDYDKDGNIDIVVAGNMYDTEPETPAYDAGRGLLLNGNGDGTFSTSNLIQYSGLNISRNVRAIESIKLGKTQKGILVANHNDKMQLFLAREDF